MAGELALSESHALILQAALDQSQLNAVALGHQLLDAQRSLKSLDDHLHRVRSDHERVSSQLAANRAALAAMVRRTYKHQSSYFVAVLNAGGFGGLLRVIGYSDAVLERERALLMSVQGDEVSLAHSQTSITRDRLAQHAAVERLHQAETGLAAQATLEQGLQRDLQASIDDALHALTQVSGESAAAANEHARLVQLKGNAVIHQVEQAVFTEANIGHLAGVVPRDPAIEDPGHLLWPIPRATITQGFGPSAYGFEPSFAGFAHFHTGIDLADRMGTPLYAAADGLVVEARAMTDADGNLVGYGNFVLLQHDAGMNSLYGHMLAMVVRPGDVVKRGQLIGLVGSSGNSTGPHTHFEVRLEGIPVDPMWFLAGSGAASTA
ncbi:MAG: M23 family metallopeptidase [Candidatus Dormibacteraeota bacterium]|nr:M23 family metallopeptidase [Candidatus Dormibacteraeota bacterium]